MNVEMLLPAAVVMAATTIVSCFALRRLRKLEKALDIAQRKSEESLVTMNGALRDLRECREALYLQEETARRANDRADRLEDELAKVNDPETQRVVQMRKQMQQDHAAFNLLCNYGAELAYGQVSPQDMMGVKEGKAE